MLNWLDRQPLKTHYTIVAMLCLLALCFVNPFHKILELRYISWDSAGYYIYLPTFLIYHDAREMKFLHDIMSRYDVSSYMYQAIKVDNGNYTMSYTMGVALLQLPAFLISHVVAKLFGFSPDGYSLTYQWGVFVIGALYALVGSCLLLKFLSKYFSKSVSLIVVLTVVLGTNLYNYGFAENSMTHGYLFFLVSALLLLTDKFYSRPNLKVALLLGLVAGMIALIRPTVVLVFLIPLLWKVNSLNALMENVRHWSRHWKLLLVAFMVLVLPFCLQMLYWQHTVGKLFFSSYAYTNQHFYFTDPQLMKGLFDWGKGWIVLTPLVVLLLLGFLSLQSKIARMHPSIFIYLIVNVWVVFSWHAWDYGGGFSARALVETYVVLAIPFAGLVEQLKQKRLLAVIGVPVMLLTVLNLFQTWQYQHDVFPNGNSWYEYKTMFGKTKRDLLPAKMLNENGLVEKQFVKESFILADSVYTNYSDSIVVSMRSTREYVQVIGNSFERFQLNSAQRLRYTSVARYQSCDPIAGCGARMCISFERDGKPYFQMYRRIGEKMQLHQNNDSYLTTTLETQVPQDFQPSDECKLFIWNSFDSPLLIKSQRVEVLTISN